jgi:tetratricopeptide (TPR) repeat protein
MRDDDQVVSNSASGTFYGGVVQAGTVHEGVHLNSAGPACSHYRELVKKFAPGELVGREQELAELAEFCVRAESSGRYVWWRAEAWSGKTALLATFALAPPAGVRVVSFFITAGWARHSERQAFVDIMLEQLWELLEQPTQLHLNPEARVTHLLGLWEQAARHCSERGQQLVLVVDGLDEDRGWDGSPDAHSIAALLPDPAPDSMRVIVSGRSNPPIPRDVPDNHPLRDPEIVRLLTPSPAAQAVRGDMERDLKRLLSGSALERDLLGLLAAAGGGLSTADLVELLEATPWQVQEYLHTASGRSFRPTAGSRSDHADEVHALAHEQLQALARSMLGPQLAEYRNRLHTWARNYAERRWPTDSPEWLFHGYFLMLADAGELERVVACATDPVRQRALRARTGGDADALLEIHTAQQLALSQEEPDLVALARLAVHRVHLQRVVSRIPPTLPAGWARLGQLNRARAMLDAIADPLDRVEATLTVARVCHNAGKSQCALKLLEQAENDARAADQSWGARPLRSVAKELAYVGQYEHAEEVVTWIVAAAERAEALAEVASRAADAGDRNRAAALLDRAEGILETANDGWRSQALSAVAVAAMKLGRTEHAFQACLQAEQVLRSGGLESVLASSVARAAARLGDDDAAMRVTSLVDESERREQCLQGILTIIAPRDGEQAETIARDVAEPARLCTRLATVAENSIEPDRAHRLISEAEQLLPQCSPTQRLDGQIAIAQATAATGDLEHAITLTRAYAEHGTDAESVLAIAAAAVRADALEHGAEMLTLAEDVARAAITPSDECRSLLWVRAMGDAKDFDRAQRLAASFHDETASSAAWALIAEAALAAGELKRAEAALATVNDVAHQRRPRLELIRSLLASDLNAHAENIAHTAPDPVHRVHGLLLIVQHTGEARLLDDAEQTALCLDDPAERMRTLLAIIETAAQLHLRTRTAALLETLRPLAQTLTESDEHNTSAMQARDVFKLCTSPVRTLTEVAEAAAIRKLEPISLFRGHDDLLSDLVPAPKNETRAPRRNASLAQRLSLMDWCYVVNELVATCPETYSAITAELDALIS